MCAVELHGLVGVSRVIAFHQVPKEKQYYLQYKRPLRPNVAICKHSLVLNPSRITTDSPVYPNSSNPPSCRIHDAFDSLSPLNRIIKLHCSNMQTSARKARRPSFSVLPVRNPVHNTLCNQINSGIDVVSRQDDICHLLRGKNVTLVCSLADANVLVENRL
jgi:hypothetical protein